MRGPIVAGTDGSEKSRLALIEAGSFATQLGLDVVVVFVRCTRWIGSASLFAVGAVHAMEEILNSKQMAAYADSVATFDSLKIGWSFEVRAGQPAGAIMRVARSIVLKPLWWGAVTVAYSGVS